MNNEVTNTCTEFFYDTSFNDYNSISIITFFYDTSFEDYTDDVELTTNTQYTKNDNPIIYLA